MSYTVHMTLKLVRKSFGKLMYTRRGNHNPYIEEQTTQWTKEKVQVLQYNPHHF